MADKKKSYNWPRRGDKAFIGEVKPDSPVHAYIDWLKGSNSDISYSFKEAADKIVKDLESGQDTKHPDAFFYPICYLYRHTVELELKAIIELGVLLNIFPDDDEYEELQGSHSLYQLWKKAEIALKTFYAGDPVDDLNAAGNIITQFHQLDKSGQSFRYGKTKSGGQTLRAAPNIVDLANLRDIFDGLYNFLEATQIGMGEALGDMEH